MYLGTEILDLCLTEDNVCTSSLTLVHIGFLDDKQDVLGFLDGNPGNAWHGLQSQLRDGLTGLLLRPGWGRGLEGGFSPNLEMASTRTWGYD